MTLKKLQVKRVLLIFVIVIQTKYGLVFSQQSALSIPLLPNEQWWSGVINEAQLMPYSAATNYSFNMLGDNDGNQVQPLLLSNMGRFVWSESPFSLAFKNGLLQITADAKIDTGSAGRSLKDVQVFVRNKYFKTTGVLPDTMLITRPQYNTWIELNYNQNEADVLKYAHAIVNNGLPVGVLMIDDTWQEDYGVWDFNARRFPHPKQMMDELHQMGFKVMVWICPFVSPDSKEYRELAALNALIKDSTAAGLPMMMSWWNGFSGEIDCSHPAGAKWFQDKLNYLQQQYGVDGFKFDAGDFNYYSPNSVSYQKITANQHSELYAKVGLQYPLNEFRACWKMGGQALVQRLRDKLHTWEDLQKLVPGMVLEGLIGYNYSCPDMIGGGELSSYIGSKININQQLLVRSAQCHALMPMMQFSVAPWRVLDTLHFNAVKKAVALRMQFVPRIMQLTKEAAATGEPIMKGMDYVFPNQGFATVNDQFMLGDDLLIAPMIQAGEARVVKLPRNGKLRWRADDGKIYKGGTTINIVVPIDRLPYFQLIK
jgi:alpha-glucosidase (family GH31 glycosyl hydrolase)